MDSANPLLLVQTWLLLLLLVAGELVALVEARHDAQAEDGELVLGVAHSRELAVRHLLRGHF